MDSRLRENDEIGPAGVGSALPCLGRFANRAYSEVRCWDAQSGFQGRPAGAWLGTSPSATGLALSPYRGTGNAYAGLPVGRPASRVSVGMKLVESRLTFFRAAMVRGFSPSRE